MNTTDQPCDCPAATQGKHPASDHEQDCGSNLPGEACGGCWACIAAQVAYHQRRVKAWIGVDPGARYTGVVGVLEGEPITWCVLDRETEPASYLSRVERAVDVQSERLIELGPVPRVAIENFVEPTPHMGLVGVRELIATAAAVGYLTRAFPGATLIRPNGHGHRPWATYPPELITKGEQRHAAARPLAAAGQSSLMRHARSAWDVALAAPLAARLATTGDRP